MKPEIRAYTTGLAANSWVVASMMPDGDKQRPVIIDSNLDAFEAARLLNKILLSEASQ